MSGKSTELNWVESEITPGTYNIYVAVYNTCTRPHFKKPLDEMTRLDQVKAEMEAIKKGDNEKAPRTKWHHKDEKCYHCMIPVDLLDIDEETQRTEKDNPFSLSECYVPSAGTQIKVTYRNGRWFVTNGKHSVIGAICTNHMYICALITIGNRNSKKAKAEDAQMFTNQNKRVTPISAMDRFTKGITFGHPCSLILTDLSKLYNFTIRPRPRPYYERSFTAITYAWQQFDKAVTLNKNSTIKSIDTKTVEAIRTKFVWVLEIAKQLGWLDSKEDDGNGSKSVISAHPFKSLCGVYENLKHGRTNEEMAEAADTIIEVLTKYSLHQVWSYAKSGYKSGTKPNQEVRAAFQTLITEIAEKNRDRANIIELLGPPKDNNKGNFESTGEVLNAA